MAALNSLLLCALCVASPPGAPCRQRFATDIARAAERFALPRSWICAVIAAESGGHQERDGAPVVSPTGAMGLMQLMPETFGAMARRYHLPAKPFAARENILAGAAYLRRCYLRFGFPLLFSAYEAGPARVENFVLHGAPLPQQTRTYLRHILHNLAGISPMMVPLKPAVASELFVVTADGMQLFVRQGSVSRRRRHQRGPTPKEP
jgi:hypothetical protein